MPKHDLVVIGGGIVGLATAWRFTERFPGRRLVVLEKEADVALHQTGRNSGVLHSGIYYKPGSLKALNCLAGKRDLEAFCAQHGVPYDVCGKVIVATRQAELPALDAIHQRGLANGIENQVIGPQRLVELEPHAAGLRALHVPSTGIVDFVAVCRKLVDLIREAGGQVLTSARVVDVRPTGPGPTPNGAVAQSTAGEFEAACVVNCAGLQSDLVALRSGATPEARIVPFRGEYFQLRPSSRRLVRNLIYPVPDPLFPFLGVHFTRMVDGSVECGPNAVLALAREGYRKTDVRAADLARTLAHPGFARLVARHWRAGLAEAWRSLSKRAFVAALQRLVPAITDDDLTPAPAGVRAQAVRRDGSLVDDFLFEELGRVVHVLNAPSPAATASLAIAASIVDRVAQRLA